MHQYKNPTFLYPNDRRLRGSLPALVAIHRQMRRRGVAAICAVKISSISTPSLAAMFAVEEVKSENSMQMMPPGFQLYRLPFAMISVFCRGNISVHQSQARSRLRRLLSSSEAPRSMIHAVDGSGPTGTKHYAVLQAIALQQTEMNWTGDG